MKERVLQRDQHPAHLVLIVGGATPDAACRSACCNRPRVRPAAAAARIAASIMPLRSAPAMAAAIAAANAAQAARQTGCGWESLESSIAARAACSGSTPRRRSARPASVTPFAWLARSAARRAADALSTVAFAAAAKARAVGGRRSRTARSDTSGHRPWRPLRVVFGSAGETACQSKAKFRIVGRLAGQRVPDRTDRQIPHALWDTSPGCPWLCGTPPGCPGCRRSPAQACSRTRDPAAGPRSAGASRASPGLAAPAPDCAATCASAKSRPPSAHRRNRPTAGCRRVRRR